MTLSFNHKMIIAISLYGFIGGLTYGHIYNEAYALQKASFPHLSEQNWRTGARLEAGMPAFGWPIYWLAAIGVELTK